MFNEDAEVKQEEVADPPAEAVADPPVAQLQNAHTVPIVDSFVELSKMINSITKFGHQEC